MNWWCIPIENCDYMPKITFFYLHKIKIPFMQIKLVVFDGLFNTNNHFDHYCFIDTKITEI